MAFPDGKPVRPRIGLVLAGIHSGSSCSVWPAIAQEAERLGADLYCFPGGRLGASDGHEIQRNFTYELASPDFLDGIITWSSSLCGSLPEAEVDRFLDRYRSLPTVSLSAGVPGTSAVSIDFYQGMRSLINHAVLAHGYTRLAFLRGPGNHPGAQERYAAYLDTLRELGLDFDPLLASDPFPWDSGDRAMSALLDERGLEPGTAFRAVIAASDLMAFGAVRVLESRDISIPGRVAVFGVNDTMESRLVSPPLTTVRSPFREQGAAAVQALLGLIRGESGPQSLRLPSRLVVRESCGCPSASLRLAGGADIGADAGRGSGEEGPAQNVLAAVGPYPPALEGEARAVIAAALGGRGENPGFLPGLSALLDRRARAGLPVSSWQDGISLLRRAVGRIGGAEALASFEDDANKARVMVGEAAERAAITARWNEERSAEAQRALDRRLLMALDYGNFNEALRMGLPDLGVRSAFIFRAEGDGAARFVAGFRDGEGIEGFQEPFPMPELAPPGLLPPGRRLCYVVEPLFFRDFRIGYALLEVGGLSGGLYEELRASLSSALRSIILFEREEAARAEAERADSVKSHLLGNVSHELKAPAALIRDGALRVLAELSRAGACPGAAKELERIVFQAEHQERLLSDLIDISRAQIEELDVERALLDPLPILREAFDDFAQRWRREGGPAWELELPAALPAVEADPTRIRQILYNLLGNAAKFTDSGFVRMSALAGPGWIELRVADSGRGIAPDRIERIFEPFVSSGGDGVGLGLSISRHLALLHGGSLRAESRAGSGSSFVLRLPLPSMEGGPARAFPPGASRIILISARTGMEAEIAAAFPGMEIQKAVPGAIGRRDFSSEGVAALAWEAESSGQAEWELLSSFRRYPPFRSLPLLIYGDGGARTCLLPKGKSPAAIIEALALQAGAAGGAPILAADDDPEALAALRALLAAAFPDSQVLCARDGEEAWGLLKSRAPRLAVLDISMPRLGGIDLLERLRADELLSKVPVLLFTSKALNLEDVKRIEGFSRVALGIKGTWTAREAQARLKRLEAGENELPAHSSAVVKRSLAYLHRNYRELVTRWRLADEANVSEDHLTRLFRHELGLSPWEYLARFRIRKAKELLETTDLSVSELSGRVGFQDQAYFSRVFRKLAGASPQAYRDSARSGGRLGSGLLYEGLEEKAGGCQPVGPQVLDEDGRAEGQGSDIAQR